MFAGVHTALVVVLNLVLHSISDLKVKQSRYGLVVDKILFNADNVGNEHDIGGAHIRLYTLV